MQKFHLDDEPKSDERIKTAANLFYLIAGLGFLNALFTFFSGQSTVLGLALTQFVDALLVWIGKDAPLSMGLAFVLYALVCGLFVVFGRMVMLRPRFFVAGLIVYALDALLFLFLFDPIPFSIHILLLWGLARGWQARRRLLTIETG